MPDNTANLRNVGCSIKQGEHVAVKIRLKKTGRKHLPSYRVVAADSRAKRDGKVLEVLGHYDPLAADEKKQFVVKRDRVQHWLDVGAQPTDTVASLLKKTGAQKV